MSLLTQWIESLAETIEINDGCLRKISPFSTCSKCMDICDADAILLNNGKPEIDEEKCTLCTKCIPECVVHAIEGNVPKREVIHDTLMYNEEMAPSRTELLYYHKHHVVKIAAENELTEEWKQQLENANQYLHAMELEPFQIIKEKPQQATVEFTRRNLFRHFAKEGKGLALSAFTPAKWRYNQKLFSLNKAYPDWYFYEVEMDREKCHLCNICYKLCPTKVFEIHENTLTMDLSKCNGCQLCQDVCQEKAITVSEYVHPKTIKEQSLYSITCPTCKNKFLNWDLEDKNCFVCERKMNFVLK